MPWIAFILDKVFFYCAGISVVFVYHGSYLHASTFLIYVGGQLVVEVDFWILENEVQNMVWRKIPKEKSLRIIVSS